MDKYISHRDHITPAETNGLFGGQGSFRRWTHYDDQAAPPFTVIAETEMAPGALAGLHVQPDQQELLYILEGCGRFEIDSQTTDVKAGDALLARAGNNFALTNTSNRPLRYLVVKSREKQEESNRR